MCMHGGIFVSPLCVYAFPGCPRQFDPPSRRLAIFSFLFSHHATMALFVEHTVLLVGSFHGWLGVDVALEFAQGRVA